MAGRLMDEICKACGGRATVERNQRYQPQDHWPDTEDGRDCRALCDLEELNDWEIGFVNSISDQVLGGRPMSGNQRDKAQQILDGRKL